MLIALLLMLVSLTILMLCALVVLGNIRRDQAEIESRVDRLIGFSLNPRTRISRADMISGPPDEELKLARLGRSSASRRVVFGGEESSELNRQLGGG